MGAENRGQNGSELGRKSDHLAGYDIYGIANEIQPLPELLNTLTPRLGFRAGLIYFAAMSLS